MILVATGTHPQQFNRLIEAVDNLVENSDIDENVVMQIGYSNYIPKNAKWFRFTGYWDMLKLIKNASLVITHAGIGSVLLSVRLNKKTIVVPRVKKFGEHTNDHQLEIVKELANQRKIIPVYDISELGLAIRKAKSFKPPKSEKSSKILNITSRFLNQL
ncbi:MAG: hypothetical protein HY361_05630 [Candidatus Aenigmarchaeota archaeon]|nr:hypothetical protein [Candidatus Aenigmarchaeota archaeon]